MIKNLRSFLLIFSLCIFLASCDGENRVPFSELLLRLEKRCCETEFDMKNAFFDKGEWLLFLPAGNGNEILLSAREDKKHILCKVLITMENVGKKNNLDLFRVLCEALTGAFAAPDDIKTRLDEVGIYNNDILFKDYAGFSEFGRYKISFFSSVKCLSFIIEYV